MSIRHPRGVGGWGVMDNIEIDSPALHTLYYKSLWSHHGGSWNAADGT